MNGPQRGFLAIALIGGVIACGCHRASQGSEDKTTDASAADSLQGIVAIAGVDALPQTMLTFEDGKPAVSLVGASALRSIAGLRVAVIGRRSGTQFTVRQFMVVAANGVPAIDGMLVADGDALTLVTADGKRLRLVSPSPALRGAVGHRVWVSGPLNRAPVAYGVIE